MVFLEYSDILPDDNFAVVFSITSDYDIKPAKGSLRADVFAGFIMRELKDTCTLTFIFHSDGKVVKRVHKSDS